MNKKDSVLGNILVRCFFSVKGGILFFGVLDRNSITNLLIVSGLSNGYSHNICQICLNTHSSVSHFSILRYFMSLASFEIVERKFSNFGKCIKVKSFMYTKHGFIYKIIYPSLTKLAKFTKI